MEMQDFSQLLKFTFYILCLLGVIYFMIKLYFPIQYTGRFAYTSGNNTILEVWKGKRFMGYFTLKSPWISSWNEKHWFVVTIDDGVCIII